MLAGDWVRRSAPREAVAGTASRPDLPGRSNACRARSASARAWLNAFVSFSRATKPTPPHPGRCGPAGGRHRCHRQRHPSRPLREATERRRTPDVRTTPLLHGACSSTSPLPGLLRPLPCYVLPFRRFFAGALTGSDALALLAVLFRRCCRRGCSSRVQAAPASGWQAGRARGRGGANFQRGRGRVWRDLEGTEGSDLHRHWTGFHVQLP